MHILKGRSPMTVLYVKRKLQNKMVGWLFMAPDYIEAW